jgi:hypothetical protein
MDSALIYIRHGFCFPFTFPMMISLLALSKIHKEFLPRWTAWFNPLFYIFVILDVVYNIVVGSVLFWEWPKEWLFTTRVQRRVDQGDNHAIFIGHVLNRLDPNHIKRLPPKKD